MNSTSFSCIDGHTCGNPVRLVIDGAPDLEGKDMSEKRQFFINNFDWIRKGLMFEPRGHDMMSGAIIYPPHNPENDCSILFIETSGCLPMCGHGTIGAVTIAIEENIVKPKTDGLLKIETPAGAIEVIYSKKNDKVEWVELTNVESYLCSENLSIVSSDLGEINFDEEFIHESYIGSKFIGTIIKESKLGTYRSITPKIKGWARIHGYNKIIIDKDDPYAYGFQVV